MRVGGALRGRAAALAALLCLFSPRACFADEKPAAAVPAAVAPAAVGPSTPVDLTMPVSRHLGVEWVDAKTPKGISWQDLQNEHPTAIVLLGADGTNYYRCGIRPATAEADKLAAVPWLTQRSPDALARVLPDGSGILVRRDRRVPDGQILQSLLLVKPAPGGGVVEEPLPFDVAAFAADKKLDGWQLRAVSGLQIVRPNGGFSLIAPPPVHAITSARRALLRLTFEKSAIIQNVRNPAVVSGEKAPQTVTSVANVRNPAVTPAAAANPSVNPMSDGKEKGTPETAATEAAVPAPAPPETREYLGWYDLDAKNFIPIFEEPRLVGAELSADGRMIHVLAQRGAEGADPTALILNDAGKIQTTPVLDALRTVGYLYRGWIDGHAMLLKKAGQDQVIIYDAATDTASAPAALGVFAASKAPLGDFALTWTGEPNDEAPKAIGKDGTAVPLDFEGPISVAEWSADGRFALLLGARNERRQAPKAWLLETEGTPRLREIVLPAPVSAARFLYEAL